MKNVYDVNFKFGPRMSENYHHGELKPALVRYAREQLEAATLDDLSMRQMAKAIGVSHTAAYRHFDNKQALLNAVAVEGFEEILDACMTAVQQSTNPPRARLRACGLAYISFGLAFPRLLAHMFHSIALPDTDETLKDAGARFFALLLNIIEEGQIQEAFRPGDSRQLSHASWAMVHGLSTLLSLGMLNGSATDIKASLSSAEQAVDVFLDGLHCDNFVTTPSGQ